MEYHKDRFDDQSLLVYKDTGLVAIFPANSKNQIMYSHQGLTYGGFIFENDADTTLIKEVYSLVIDYLKSNHIKTLVIKPLPVMYNVTGIANIWEHQKNCISIKQHIVLALDYKSNYKIHKTKLKRFRKLENSNFKIKSGKQEFEPFWNTVLIQRLKDKHEASPVHSLNEIQQLKSVFENEIQQYNIYLGSEILAGITIFDKGLVVKSQYAMATAQGERLYALDMLFVHLIYKFRDDKRHYFSMGTVNNHSSIGFSKGMMKQKQELGCTTYLQDIYKLTLND